MTSPGSRWYFAVLTCVACVACGDSGSESGNSGGSGAQSSGGSAGSASGGASGSGGSAGSASGGTAGYTVCGGQEGQTCASNEFCDYEPSTCGANDATGVCTPRPDGCNEIYEPVCACDGTVYGNSCVAQQAGVDQNDLGGCEPPAGYIACGTLFCEAAFSYCEKVTDDTGGPTTYTCKSLPDECIGQTACTCFPTQTPCSDWCEVVTGTEASGFLLTCPGG